MFRTGQATKVRRPASPTIVSVPPEGLMVMDDFSAGHPYPHGAGPDGGTPARRGALRRRLSDGAARCVRAVRAVPAGAVVASLVTVSGMTVVLQLAGAWPFAPHDVPDSVPGARLPLPPSAVDAGGSPSGRGSGEGRDADRPEDVGGGGGKQTSAPAGADDGDQAKAPPTAGQGMTGRTGEAGNGGTGNRGCRASWHVDGQWEDFNATVTVTATAGERLRGWEVTWTWADGQRLVKGWNGEFRTSGAEVGVRNSSGSAGISPTGETTFGFQATGSGSPAPRLTCHCR
ncbi:cellulose binding domain-containing protein [Streptomyces marispadix]|uniref:Cellulose-binding domain-containing protein n=1 Tax=Streptomyces marispadix TaxID=2922868 RepID=A0ABS9T495_9ACTN|nr:cellulose binding domain-containing protein [Streptomyces marispadix]MCH6163346.1 cellulose-binding domain-containing protein [Streptomyces marispadix]